MRFHFTLKEHQNAGLALLLLLLLIKVLFSAFVPDAVLIAVILITSLLPRLLFPFSVLWYNLSDILGHIISYLFLNVVYWLLVVPIALARKAWGKDSLKIKQYKKNHHSVFHERNYTFTSKDLSNIF